MVSKVKITPIAVKALSIKKISAKNGKDIDFELEEIKTGPDNYFLLTVRNKRQSPGNYFDLITIQTEQHPEKPIKVRVAGHILK